MSDRDLDEENREISDDEAEADNLRLDIRLRSETKE